MISALLAHCWQVSKKKYDFIENVSNEKIPFLYIACFLPIAVREAGVLSLKLLTEIISNCHLWPDHFHPARALRTW